jgi:hypothetical protein
MRPEGANFDGPAFCPQFISIFLSYASVMCSGVATGARAHPTSVRPGRVIRTNPRRK